MRLEQVTVTMERGRVSLGPWNFEGPDDVPWLILGPSGSGKTTLLRVLAERIPFAGRVVKPVGTKETAYVPQFPERVLAGRNLAEDLSNVLNPGAEQRRALRALLRDRGVDASLHRESRSLSGGEKRRLLLALVAAAGWGSWAWDEPEAGLDVDGRRRLLAWLTRALETTPGPHWLATNSPWMYLGLNPYCVVLKKGAVIYAGMRDDVLSHAESRTLLGLSTHPAGRVWNDIAKEIPHLDDNVWKKLSFGSAPVSQLQVVLRDSEVDS